MQREYRRLIRRCISLAKRGEGKVSPNPLVGAVIFDDNFNIISEGWHKKYGENHAERNAILDCKEDLIGKSVAVNLEPCSHFGKTPPCADLIIEKGIKRVVVGMVDPNPIVKGNGIKKLQDAGIEVITGVLEDECRELNKVFIKNQIDKKPYIVIKTATTLDGKIATKIGSSKWITDAVSRYEVQKMRNKYDAVLTSSATVKKDNPSLTCRKRNGRNPVRIILDTNLSSPSDSKVYQNDGTRVIVVVSDNVSDDKIKTFPSNVEFIKCPKKNNHIDIKQAVYLIYNAGIKSIMIEAGGMLNKAFINDNLADEWVQFIAPKILGDSAGISCITGFDRSIISECNNLNIKSTKILKNDIMIISKFGCP